MKKQRWLVLLLVLIFVLTSGVLAACKQPEPPVVKYTVTYKADGAEVKAIEVESGKSLTASQIPGVPTKEGYTGKWDTDMAGVAVTANKTVNATYTKVEVPVVLPEYTVSFDTHGGSALEAIKVKKGEKAVQPADPTLAGKILDGWYVDAAYLTPFDFATPITADIKLHAKWKTAEFTVTVPSAYELSYANVGITKISTFDFATLDTTTWSKADLSKKVAYGTKIYVAYSGTVSGRTLFVYQDGKALTPAQVNYVEGVYTIEVKADTVITVSQSFAATFKGDTETSQKSDIVTAIVDGSVVLPKDPTKTGYTFAGWFVSADADAKAIDNGKLAASASFYAHWTINKYKVTIDNKLGTDVSVELGKTEANYNTTVGFKVIDKKVTLGGTALNPTYTLRSGAPILIKITNNAGSTYTVMGTAGVDMYEKIFEATVEGDVTITITAEYRAANVNLTWSAKTNVKFYKEATKTTEITANIAGYVANAVAGQKIVWFIEVDQDWTPAITTGTSYEAFALEQVKDEDGKAVANLYKVSYTMPALTSASDVAVDINSCITLTEKEYKVNGLNVETDAWILAQQEGTYAASTGYKLLASTSSNIIKSFKESEVTASGVGKDAYYEDMLVFVVKDSSKVYNVYLGDTVILTTSSAATRYYKVGDKVYDAYVIPTQTLYGMHADQEFSVVAASKVSVITDGGTPVVSYEETGKVFNAGLTAVPNSQVVKVNGIIINGTVGATTTSYQYEITGDTKIEILTKYTVSYNIAQTESLYPITYSDMTVNALYGETVSFKVAGEKAGNILYVKAEGATAKMLGPKDGVYSFVIGGANGLAGNSDNAFVITSAFTSEYITVVYGTDDQAFFPVAELATIPEVNGAGAPTQAGKVFAGWKFYDYNKAGITEATKYVQKVVTTKVLVAGDALVTVADLKTVEAANLGEGVDKLGAGDKLVAQWTEIKPVVRVIKDANTDFELRSIAVNGSTIFVKDTAWVDYRTEMLANATLELKHTDVITLTFRAYMDKDVTANGRVAKVFVGNKEIVADQNGQYVINLADFDYTTAADALVIRTEYTADYYAMARDYDADWATGGVSNEIITTTAIPSHGGNLKQLTLSGTTWSLGTTDITNVKYITLAATATEIWLPVAADAKLFLNDGTTVYAPTAAQKSGNLVKVTLTEGSVNVLKVLVGETWSAIVIKVA